MSLTLTPHRGETTTRALLAAALGGSDVDLTVVIGASDLRPSGTVILDIDENAPTGAPGERTVGFSSVADYSARDVITSARGTSFRIGNDSVELALVGERHIVPALAALAAAVESGVPRELAISRIQSVVASEAGNLTLIENGGVLFIDDSYDAGSRSTVEALKTVAEIAGEGRRSIAVLGELAMASLDPIDVRDQHDRIGRIVVRLNIGQLVVVGDAGRHLSTAAALEGSWDGESVLVADPVEAYDLLRAEIREGDIVLVKIPALAGKLAGVLA